MTSAKEGLWVKIKKNVVLSTPANSWIRAQNFSGDRH